MMYLNNNVFSPYAVGEWLEDANDNNMVIMENYYSQDHLREIRHRIDQLHLSYLEKEESPEKLEQRNKLEDCIAEYLCITSHNQKFFLAETEQVLQKSAGCKRDFSGYKAATGWNAVQMYAGNLLSQPWRKEYRTIKTYCGFYKHQIEANLMGAQLLFEVMGYKHTADGVLVLDGPICPDLVASVSKDCLIAYVECQIMKIIWEEVSALNVSWLDVLEFRKVHLCSPEQSIKALKYKHHQRQYQDQRQSYQEPTRAYSQSAEPFQTSRVPPNHSFPPMCPHMAVVPQNVPQYHYGNGCCANGCGYGHYGCLPYVQAVGKPQPYAGGHVTNGYYYPNGFVAPALPTGYSYPVPTAQLIELEAQNGYDSVDSGRPRRVKQENIASASTSIGTGRNPEYTETRITGTESEKEFEDWDYVYKNLESQGYRKDLGERGDILSPDKRRSSKETKSNNKPTNLDDAFAHLTVSDRPSKVTDVSERKPNDRRMSQGSSYENLSVNDAPKLIKTQPKATSSSQARTKTLPREKPQNDSAKTNQSKTLDLKRTKEEKNKAKSDDWQCKACTYLNATSREICEMCNKSRAVAAESPMEVGGSECPKCTLVNPKHLKICDACGASLKNSPTYI